MREEPSRASEPTHRMAVLVLDDEKDNLDVIYRSLHKDFQVHLASSGSEALRLLSRIPISVIISDQRMPEMAGVEFLQRAIIKRGVKRGAHLMQLFDDRDVQLLRGEQNFDVGPAQRRRDRRVKKRLAKGALSEGKRLGRSLSRSLAALHAGESSE